MDDDWGQEILLIPNGTTSWWPENFEQERLGLSGAGSILTGYVRMKDADFKDPSAELLKLWSFIFVSVLNWKDPAAAAILV